MTLKELIKNLFKTLGQWLDTERTIEREQMIWNRCCYFVAGGFVGAIMMAVEKGVTP